MTDYLNDERDFAPFDEARGDAIRTALMAHVAEGAKKPARKRRRIITIVVPSVLLAIAVTGATLWLVKPVTDQGAVHCFARAEIDWFGGFPGATVSAAAPNAEQVPVDDAIALCTQVWKDGLLDPEVADGTPQGPDGRPIVNERRDSPVPDPLTVCVMRDGTAAVLPGPATICSRAGLASRQER
ncbi:hypothetical protein [Compostimonas suwonensis]|uniref:Uncharacterized protein n=1 Tax=Compostimonas suwonensis TaxID=1048394 RepID=A0A2M9C071_9MICO|nr:hypothetical protein [Compostimonas suwonensis]PJJ63729.1 hypothetical protein CLV54_1403 [Compostimonas suwonensis]